jgi:hypothetical protein
MRTTPVLAAVCLAALAPAVSATTITAPFGGTTTVGALNANDLVNLTGTFGSFIVNGPVTGSGTLRLANFAISLSLSGVNTFSGGVILDGLNQSLYINQPSATGSGPLIFNNSSLDIVSITGQPGGTMLLPNDVVLNNTTGNNALTSFVVQSATTHQSVAIQSLTSNGVNAISFGIVTGSATSADWSIPSITVNGKLSVGGQDETITVSTGGSSAIFDTSIPPGTVTIGSIHGPSTSALTFSPGAIVHLAESGDSSFTAVNTTQLFADAPQALGLGALNNSAGTLTLTVAAAAANTVTGGIVFYNANNAAGGNAIQQADVYLNPSITSLGADTFTNLSAIHGNSTTLALLDRGGASPNASFQPLALVENTDGTLPTVHNLGANADLILGLGAASASPVTIGAGTAWAGLQATGYHGAVTVNSDVFLNGSYTDGLQILSSATPANITLNGDLAISIGYYPGAAKFIATPNTRLLVDSALGGANGSSPVPIDIPAFANLTITSSAAINAAASFHGNSTLTIQSAGLTGSGGITRDPAPMSFVLANSLALSGPQLSGLIRAGDQVQLSANDIESLNALDPAVTIVIPSGTITQSTPLSLNGAGLIVNGTLLATPGSSFAINIGSAGATLDGAGGTIAAPVNTTGNLTVGSKATASTSTIILTSTGNSIAGTISVYANTLSFSAAAIGNGLINLLGGALEFSSPSSSSVFSNPINILGNSVLQRPFNDQGSVTLSNVFLGNATVTIRPSAIGFNAPPPIAITNLQLQGDGIILLVSNFATNPVPIATISQDGLTPRALTLGISGSSPSTKFLLNGSIASTGIITFNASTSISATITPAAAPFVIGSAVTLSSGNVPRPITLAGGTLTFTDSANAAMGISGPGVVSLASGDSLLSDAISVSTLTLAGYYTLRPNTGPSTLTTLSINNNASAGLEIANNPLILQPDPRNKAAALTSLQSQVAYGLTHAEGGITSSTTAAGPGHKTTIVVDNALLGLTQFNGVTVDANSLLVESTWLGDSNLDRKVDVTDLGLLATNYGQSVFNGVLQGDFNQDGKVDVTDLGLLATNYGAGTAGQPYGQSAVKTAAVPEPASLLLCSASLGLLLRRRR